MSRLFTGTSGYSYQDWRGIFYPVSLDSGQYLSYYSNFFDTVEVNFTYYRFPEPYMFSSMVKNIEKSCNFIFSIKANSLFTHERKFTQSDIDKFTGSIKPLSESGRLGSILFQFPYSFYYTKQNIDFLSRLLDGFKDFEKCAEFRNNSWLNEETMDCLKNLNTGFCNVDEPGLKGLLPPTSICTSENAYIRFHGRNSINWWNPLKAYQRYDYMYTKEELFEWVPKVKELKVKARKLYIYFNNHYKAKAVSSAVMFMDLFRENNIV